SLGRQSAAPFPLRGGCRPMRVVEIAPVRMRDLDEDVASVGIAVLEPAAAAAAAPFSGEPLLVEAAVTAAAAGLLLNGRHAAPPWPNAVREFGNCNYCAAPASEKAPAKHSARALLPRPKCRKAK